jgi:Skp family chaperone for outer membrane proteins
MPRIRTLAVVPLLIALCVVVTLVTTRVTGVSLVPQKPAVVGVLNLDSLLAGLDRRQDLQDEFRQREQEITATLQAKLDQINAEKEELAALEGTPDYQRRREALRRREAMLAAESAYEREKLLKEDVEAVQDLYLEITAELKTFSEANGIDLVLIDSSPAERFPVRDGRILNNEQTMQAIASWETIYVSPQIDITDDLIVYMNNNGG